MNRDQLKLYLVTDRQIAGDCDIMDVVADAVRGGVTMVQLREKHIDTREFVALASEMKKTLAPFGVPLIINDRVDVALCSAADGVHIGQRDMPYEMARRLLGPDRIIGLSVENFAQIEQANAWDVDYIAVSPVFSTLTKTDTAPAFGVEGLRQAAGMSVHPVVGIGGINENTAAEVISAGADGIAVVSAIVGAASPQSAARRLKNIICGAK